MSDNEILEILLKFKEYLSDGWIVMDVFRSLGWIIILGLGWLVESLENITDTILGLKTFFQDAEMESLLDMLQPLSIILMAFSFLYTGYMLIFQKKVDREGVIVNVFLALVVLALMGTGMQQANKFTDQAVAALNGEENSSIANSVIKKGILDVGLYDLQGWKNPEIDPTNNISEENIRDIDINSYLTDGTKITKDKELSNNGVDILSNKIDTLGDGSQGLLELDDGNFITDITKEYYYRYTVDWFTIMVTLAITAFTLLTISIKLAKLFFELAFNYVLATIIAPADIHSGQKTKQVLQNILNIFLVTIMIFLSMKIYLIGTGFIDDKLTGLPYLIALFAFSLAVIDGPNIVERLFGIDAGLKSGWGTLAGAYAGAKGLGKGVKGLSSATKSAGVKGFAGLAGGAGVIQGLSSAEQKGEQSPQSQTGNGPQSQGLKGNGNPQADGDKANNGQGVENQENKAESEMNAGKEQAASSLEQEMNQANQGSKQVNQGQGNGNATQGLHQEMASKGMASKGTTSNGITSHGNVSNQGSKNSLNQPSGMNQGNTASNSGLQQMANNTGVVARNVSGSGSDVSNSVNTGASLSDQISSSNIGDNGANTNETISVSSGGNESVQSNVSSDYSTPSNNNTFVSTSSGGSNQSVQEVSRSQSNQIGGSQKINATEDRHIGTVISDNVRQNRTVQKTQRSYQIGKNTGQSIKKNIVSYREKVKKNMRGE